MDLDEIKDIIRSALEDAVDELWHGKTKAPSVKDTIYQYRLKLQVLITVLKCLEEE